MSRGIPVVWLQDAKNPKEFENTLRNSTLVLGKLQQIILDYLAGVNEEERTDDFLSKPNLTERVVFNRGQEKALTKMLTLLAFLNRE